MLSDCDSRKQGESAHSFWLVNSRSHELEKVAHFRAFATHWDLETLLFGVDGSQPITFFLQWQRFHQIRSLALGMNLVVDNCHVSPACSKLLVSMVV